MTSQQKNYNQIEENLHKQFDKQSPLVPADQAIMTDESQILRDFINANIFGIQKSLKFLRKI